MNELRPEEIVRPWQKSSPFRMWCIVVVLAITFGFALRFFYGG